MDLTDLKFGAAFGIMISLIYQLLIWLDPLKSILIISGAICMFVLQTIVYLNLKPSPSEHRVFLAEAAEKAWTREQAAKHINNLLSLYRAKDYFISDDPLASPIKERKASEQEAEGSGLKTNSLEAKLRNRVMSSSSRKSAPDPNVTPFEANNQDEPLKIEDEIDSARLTVVSEPPERRTSVALNDPVLKEARSAFLSDSELEEDGARLLGPDTKKKLIKTPKMQFIESVSNISGHMKLIASFEETYAKRLSEFGKGGLFLSKNLEVFNDDTVSVFQLDRLPMEVLNLFEQLAQESTFSNENNQLVLSEWRVMQSGQRHIGEIMLGCCSFIKEVCSKGLGGLVSQYEASHKELTGKMEEIKKEYDSVYPTFERIKTEYETTKKRLEVEVTAYRQSIKEKVVHDSQLRLEMRYRKTLASLLTLKTKYVSARAAVEINRSQVKEQNKEIKAFLNEWQKKRSQKIVSTLRSFLSTALETNNGSYTVFSDILFAKNQEHFSAIKSGQTATSSAMILPEDEEGEETEQILQKNLLSGEVSMRSYIDQLIRVFKILERRFGYLEAKLRQAKDISTMIKQIVERENEYILEIGKVSGSDSFLKEDSSIFTLLKCIQKAYIDSSIARKALVFKLMEMDQKTSEVTRMNEKEMKSATSNFSSIGQKLNEIASKVDSDIKKKREMMKMSKMTISPDHMALESLNPLLLSELNLKKSELSFAKKKSDQILVVLEEHSGFVKLELSLFFGIMYQNLQRDLRESIAQVDQTISAAMESPQRRERASSGSDIASQDKSTDENPYISLKKKVCEVVKLLLKGLTSGSWFLWVELSLSSRNRQVAKSPSCRLFLRMASQQLFQVFCHQKNPEEAQQKKAFIFVGV